MQNKIFKKLASQKGAMDKVLVTLLLTIIAVVGIIGIERWSSNKKDEVLIKANTTITDVLTETNTNKK